MKVIRKSLQDRPSLNVTVGYRLLEVLPLNGTVNRGIFETERNLVKTIREELGLSIQNYREKGIPADALCSMNLFGLSPELLNELEKDLIEFKKTNKNNRKIELPLSTELSKLAQEGTKIFVYEAEDKWVGLTNPEDEETVREYLRIKEI